MHVNVHVTMCVLRFAICVSFQTLLQQELRHARQEEKRQQAVAAHTHQLLHQRLETEVTDSDQLFFWIFLWNTSEETYPQIEMCVCVCVCVCV